MKEYPRIITIDLKRVFSALMAIVISASSILYIEQTNANTDTANLSVNVSPYFISLTITSGGSINFGNLTPGTPVTGASGTAISIETSSELGYSLAINDGVVSPNSALLHSDTTTRIAKYAGTIGVPTTWTGNGLGFSLYSGSSKDAKWGTGTTYNDANNKYAGVTQNATIIMSTTSYNASPDVSYVGWKLDVPNDQKTGAYSGTVTFTATANTD